MALALPLTDYISQSSAQSTKYATLKVRFGNGYEQRTPDGINTTQRSWTITYNNLSTTDRNTVWTFLNTVQGTAWWTWTPPGGTSLKWVVDGDVQERVLSGNLYTISFTARQVFDLV